MRMTPANFVASLDQVAVKAVADGVTAGLERPPGRNPDPMLVELSKWFSTLESGDRHLVKVLIEDSARQAVYNVLLILDGLLAIEPTGSKGKFDLTYSKGEESIVLNSPADEFLSVMFKEVTPQDSR